MNAKIFEQINNALMYFTRYHIIIPIITMSFIFELFVSSDKLFRLIDFFSTSNYDLFYKVALPICYMIVQVVGVYLLLIFGLLFHFRYNFTLAPYFLGIAGRCFSFLMLPSSIVILNAIYLLYRYHNTTGLSEGFTVWVASVVTFCSIISGAFSLLTNSDMNQLDY